ncbi:hypothetical protein AB3K25_09885 [Leuconostoc sp. MS02]|uniref:Uncharacterized protein n=1 Tax=Leuconostoc aquikimchii TaxID=3236804 RepID=A0ABV3S026_9LACO
MNKFEFSNNFQGMNNQQLSEVSGGKIIRVTQWQLYNTTTHKYFADNSAIMSTTGRTVVSGWFSSFRPFQH